jgi:hypothetical protein
MYTNPEIPAHSPPGIDEISKEVLETHAHSTNDFDTLYNQLKKDNPDLANQLVIDAHLKNERMDDVNTFAKGVLYLYGLLRDVQERKDLEQLLLPAIDTESTQQVGNVDNENP